ncbi:hypothetical protein OAG71_04095 [bacterium]|nr:hypothetical protein [bacterium]
MAKSTVGPVIVAVIPLNQMKTSTSTSTKRIRWPRHLLRIFLIGSGLFGVAIGLIGIQQQRQRNYYKVVEFVKRSFRTGESAIPKRVTSVAKPRYDNYFLANCSSSNVERPSNNAPPFIASEHELVYCPSMQGYGLANVTVLVSWHVLQSKPRIAIVTDCGEFDDVVTEHLSRDLVKHFGIEPAISAAPLNGRCTPLQRAVFCGDANDLNLLIQEGADVDRTVPSIRATPLQCSIRYGRPDFAEILLIAGADPNKICNERTALDFLFTYSDFGALRTLPKKDFVRLEQILIEHGGTERIKWAKGEKEPYRNSPHRN